MDIHGLAEPFDVHQNPLADAFGIHQGADVHGALPSDAWGHPAWPQTTSWPSGGVESSWGSADWSGSSQ